MSIDKIFLFIALTWGLVTIFLVPPFEVMDEQRHYVRAGAIAEGVWNCTNGKLQISEKKIDLINYSNNTYKFGINFYYMENSTFFSVISCH